MRASTPAGPDGGSTHRSARPEREALRLFREDPLSYVLALHRERGDVAQTELGRLRICVLGHPDHFRDVLVSRKSSFEKGVAYGGLKQVLGDGLLTSEGELHDRQRRLVYPAFQHGRLLAHASAIAGEASAKGTDWAAEQRVDIIAEMGDLAHEIVSRTILDADATSARSALLELYGEVDLLDLGRSASPFAHLLEQMPTPQSQRLERLRAAFEETVEDLIEQRRRTGTDGRGDVLSRLLDAAEASEDPIPDRLIRDEVLTVLLVGQDTVTSALTWSCYAFARHPEARERLEAEVDDVLSGKLPDETRLPQLPYTQAFFAETLRMYPPVWCTSRTAIQDVRLGDTDVSSGSVMLLAPYLLHHDERWFDEPEEFRPERWLPDAAQPGHAFAYIPFGAGPRVCVGQALAKLAGAIVLATVAQRWDLETLEETTLDSRSMLRPAGGLTLVAKPRRAA